MALENFNSRSRQQSTTSTSAPSLNDTDQVSFFRQKAQEVAGKVSQQVRQTITRQEQAAFDSLRRLVGQRELKTRLGITPEPDRLDIDPDNILALYTPQTQRARPSAETDADADASTVNAAQQAQAAEIERIIHEICRKQLHSLAASFRSALSSDTKPGDLALWDALEFHVFPLLNLLKSSQPPLHARPSQRSTKHHTAAVSTSAAIAAEKAAATKLLPLTALIAQFARNKSSPPSVPPLKVLSRYYPAALLLAIRLLTKHHSLSLQTHCLLPHLRTLGPSSYILGVTAPFYNTYLLLRWNVYSSLRELCDILSEMERSAVDFDRGTHRFLTDLAEERNADLVILEHDPLSEPSPYQERDPTPHTREPEWWLQAEQQRWWPQLEEWRVKVSRALEERGMGVVQREGPESSQMVQETPFAGVKPQVWL